jgi:hypothetical protein
MNKLIIEPGVGIGTIKLGMAKSEVDCHINEYVQKYEKGTSYFNFFKNAFKIEYDKNEKVKFIEIISAMNIFLSCQCHDIDVFSTKADELIPKLNQISEHEDTNDEFQFVFTNIGLSLWRSSVFKEMDEEDQEEEKKFMYFQTVAVYPNDGLYYKGLL